HQPRARRPPRRPDRHHAHVPRELPVLVGGRGRLRLRRRGAVRRARGRRLLPRVRRRPVRRLRAAALRAAGQDGRARPRDDDARRYRHKVDRTPAPLDPGFDGAGRCLTDTEGRYRFVTIKPGAYPWGNHPNAWRPAHIHFSLLGPSFTQRLVTQMYFPGDPLFAHDPIFNAVRDARARDRLVARFSMEGSQENWALAYEFDIVLSGPDETP